MRDLHDVFTDKTFSEGSGTIFQLLTHWSGNVACKTLRTKRSVIVVL
jgi:hypothetical protein